jgi:uncharacterized protein YjbI with pentapeptide repeats
LVGHLFQQVRLDSVDFSAADLRIASFIDSCLRGSDFSCADLRGASFVRCDLRGARFAGTAFAHNWFFDSCFVDATGLSKDERAYIQERGGSFLRLTRNEAQREVAPAALLKQGW